MFLFIASPEPDQPDTLETVTLRLLFYSKIIKPRELVHWRIGLHGYQKKGPENLKPNREVERMQYIEGTIRRIFALKLETGERLPHSAVDFRASMPSGEQW
jgi:hypothetical protein